MPQSQLPALNDDEMLDRLERTARSGLAAQAKQVQSCICSFADVSDLLDILNDIAHPQVRSCEWKAWQMDTGDCRLLLWTMAL